MRAASPALAPENLTTYDTLDSIRIPVLGVASR